jgi:hypothetical protein
MSLMGAGSKRLPKLRVNNGVNEKLCSSCGLWKPLGDFSPGGGSHGASEGGKHCECRPCNAARHRGRMAAAKGR